MARICPVDCPKRGKKGCHTDACKHWKEHVERKKLEYKQREEKARLRTRSYEER